MYHELRHAMQYLKPERFDETIQESRFYVVLYNGTCFKLVDHDWKECVLDGEEEYFTAAYLSLPYEMDANTFAYERVKRCAEIRRNCSDYIEDGCRRSRGVMRSTRCCFSA